MRQPPCHRARAIVATAVAVLVVCAVDTRAVAQGYDASPIQTSLVFDTVCTSEASAELHRGASLLFFAMADEALVAFQRAGERDPECALARWGESVALARLPAFDTTPVALARGRAALAGAAAATRASRRDTRLIAATHALFDATIASAPLRIKTFGDAMHGLAHDDPADVLALGSAVLTDLVRTTLPDDEPVRRARDQIAHAYPDLPAMPLEIAFLRLLVADDAADETMAVATRLKTAHTPTPAPAHAAARIFHRVGHWDDAIAAAETARRIAGGWLEPLVLTPPAWIGLLPEWAVVANAQRGRGRQGGAMSQACASASATAATALDETLASRVAGACLRLDIRAWWADVDWQGAVSVPVPPGHADDASATADVESDALVILASGLYHARAAWPRGEPELIGGARTAVQHLEALARAHPEHSRAIELNRLLVSMALAGAYESRDELLVYEVQAGDLERLLDASRLGAPRLVGVDRLAGELHLRLHDYREAREHFTRALARQPNDARALLGLARAASRMHDAAAAREAARHFIALWASVPSRAEVVEAEGVVAQ